MGNTHFSREERLIVKWEFKAIRDILRIDPITDEARQGRRRESNRRSFESERYPSHH